MAEERKQQVEGKPSSWDEEKRIFARQAMSEALQFMRLDNQVIGHFATITGTLAEYLKEHPQAIIELAGERKPSSPSAGAVSGGDFWGDLLGIIETVLVKDKQFWIDLISKLLGI